MAWAGAAQKPRASEPVALGRPAISAALLAKLPPPRWFMSPQASSAQSTTYSTSSLAMPAFFTAERRAMTELALLTRFSCMTWAERFTSMSWARLTQPTSWPLW